MDLEVIILISASLIAVGMAIFSYKLFQKIRQYEKRYSKIINIDDEFERVQKAKFSIEQNLDELKKVYKEKYVVFEQLLTEIAIYNEEIELAELGFYKPHYDFDTSEKYKKELSDIKNIQKEMIREKVAIECDIEWAVQGSKAKGKTMTNRGIRLTARAFNNECDAAISNVTWSNAVRLEQRIIKAYGAINKLNESNRIFISSGYLDLKLSELRLAHEYKEKKQQEKEEQAEIKQQMREEAQLEKEMDKAQKEEEKYQKLLEKAKKDVEKASGSKLKELQDKIISLNDQLDEAHSKNIRAKSMAQQTKAGHVYVISNIGSFGENIYKIGMTRRLEPLDRVKELGDASVPFRFDVHAMIYSTDAPNLEKTLHKSFDVERLNLVNNRKEFFKVKLEDVKDKVLKFDPTAEFNLTLEAREFRESNAIRAQQEKAKENKDLKFPKAI